MLEAFKSQLKLRRSMSTPTPPVKTKLNAFPATVSQFMMIEPGIYQQDDPPVDARIDTKDIEHRRANKACRSTHRTVAPVAAQTQPATNVPESSLGHAMLNNMAQLFMQNMAQSMMPVARAPPVHIHKARSSPALLDLSTPMPALPSPEPEDETRTSPGSALLPVAMDAHGQLAQSPAAPKFDSKPQIQPSISPRSSMPDSDTHGLDFMVAQVQDALRKKEASKKDDIIDDQHGPATGKGRGRGRGKGKGSGRGSSTGKGTSKGKAKTLASASDPQHELSQLAAASEPRHPTIAAGSDGKRKAPSEDRPAMPPLGIHPPFFYRGCKVYSSPAAKKWRVMPRPGGCLYDRAFAWGSNPQAKWQQLLAYCEDPVLPARHAG